MFLKNKLFLSVVLFVIGWPGFSFANSAKCQKIFTLTKEEAAGRVLKDKTAFVRDYKGMEGYALFAERYYKGDMLKAYDNLSAVIGETQIATLGWRQYPGSVNIFREDRSRILDEGGNIKDEYKGMEGYALFAERYYEGDMFYTYENLFYLLEKTKMRELGWWRYPGSVNIFRENRGRILDGEGKIKPEYKGMEGFARFADRYYDGDMFKAYFDIPEVLEKTKMKALSWQAYHGSAENFREDRSRILDEGGNIKDEYKGMEGYALFAERYYKGDMFYTYENLSAVVEKTQMKALSWQAYKGSAGEFIGKLRILDGEGNIKDEYKGIEGYALFAERHYGGDMFYAYVNLSAVLEKIQMKELGWQVYQGSVENFREDRSRILDGEGNIKDEYKGMEGYARFAERYYEGNMLKAYDNLSAVLEMGWMWSLGWRRYPGSVNILRENQSRILDGEGKIKDEYKGIEGLARFAERYYEGDVLKAYYKLSEVLEKTKMRALGWPVYYGSIESFREDYSRILDGEGKIKDEYKGIEGLARFADKYYDGDMHKAYKNLSAVLGGVRRIRELDLGWKNFQGSTSQYRALKELFEVYGLEGLRGAEGHKKVATIFKGHEERAYYNVYRLREQLLGSLADFDKLKWMTRWMTRRFIKNN